MYAVSYCNSCGAHSYNVSPDCLEKGFEHSRVLLVPSLGISLPLRQPRLLYQSLVDIMVLQYIDNTYLLGIYRIQWKNSTR